ncbi:Outer membrane receptor proteins, mostly Fe transport [Chitinophaga jiangningensis]|uniref:Outer membrane receptor proteins, mostly Fe transport n=1 Tax=Chitinophaga jiangningensis TaxID=1419482 RepID=A0A1M7JZM1_9BACT|nr:outer membrane beta-barrel family protein [Chitinophaga jiangningensis]SHM58466.1 Outer membrane receptor proteins, mostly Fe transport [Chitinophaga jiangningensis]
MLNGKLITLYLFSCIPIASFAQTNPAGYTIRGVVADATTRQPVPYATIGITNGQQTPLTAAYSGENGSFRLQLHQRTALHVIVTSVGYQKLTTSLQADNGKEVYTLDTLFLQSSAQDLGEVEIIARKQLVEQKPGMLVFNAENDISLKGGTAADVLRKAPALNVDPQGNVSMRGSSTLKILINGKFSGQIARSPADALNMIPASIIKSVEIITSPSAKYDAEGAAGVINIITKKGQDSFSGALEATASNWEQAVNPRISFSNDKWNMSAYAHIHRLRSKSVTSMERTAFAADGTPESTTHQDNAKDNIMPHGSGEFTLGFTPDSLSEFSLNVNTWIENWPGSYHQTSRIYNATGILTDEYAQQVKNKERFIGTDIALGYNRRLRHPGQEITLLAQYSPGKETTGYTNQQSADHELRYTEINEGITYNHEWTFQADYTQPLTRNDKYLLEGGLKSIFRNADNKYNVWAAAAPATPALIAARSDNFVYAQQVVAGYLLIKMKLPRNWYTEAGGRLEHTDIHGTFHRAGTTFKNDFLNLIPTASLTKKLTEQHTLTGSYTKRLTRPYIWDLNPNADASDPRNVSTGNPALLPENMHQGELTYSWTANSGFFLNAAAFIKRTDNSIIELTTVDAAGIATTRKENLAGNQQYGLNLSSAFSLAKNWNVNTNLNINHLDFNSSALMIVNTGWAADININTSYKLPGNFALQAFGEYNTRIVTLQGYKTSRYYYSFSAKKELKESRMTITVAAINPFNQTIAQAEVLKAASFLSRQINGYYNQALKITLNWEFGSVFEQKKGKQLKVNNDDVSKESKG